MKNFNNISDIDITTDEGKLLLSAVAILTSIDTPDVRYGSTEHPDNVLKRIENLATHIFENNEHVRIETGIYQKNILKHNFIKKK
jgi:hypothetical protein